MQKASKTSGGPRRKEARRPSDRGPAVKPVPKAEATLTGAGGQGPEVAAAIAALGLDEEAAVALHGHIALALEAGARAGNRATRPLAKARGIAASRAAATVPATQLIPLVLAIRDALKRGAPGGRGSRARDERLQRATDAALVGIAEAAGGRGSSPRARAKVAAGEPVDEALDPLAVLQRDRDAAREVLQRLLALTPDAAISVRQSGRLGLWNSAASRMTGRRRWEVQRRGLASVFRDRETFEALVAELDERGRVARREVTLVNAAGDEVPARLYAARLDSSSVTGVDADQHLLLLHDLSEVQHIRKRLIETEKLSAMAKIAGSVAHEFRNPLNSLFLSTDLLEDELEGQASVRKAIAPTLAAIREEIERLNQIIKHYLSLSKISSASPEQMDLGKVAFAFTEEYAAQMASDTVDLRLRADDGSHEITADPNQVRRILVNLVENAVQAVTGDGVEADAPSRRGRITIYVRRMRRTVKVTVKDNGPGIPEELRERVFEPFFTSRAGGSGLGLYLVREVALASGGTLTLSSTVARGTSISVRWPHADPVTPSSTAK